MCSFYDSDIWFWNFSDSVVCFGIVPTVWYVLELFRQCGMFWNCSDTVVCFGIVPTVWYVLKLFRQCGMFWNCSDIVVCFAFNFISNVEKDITRFT